MECLLPDPHNYLMNSLELTAHAATYYVVVGSLIIMSEKMEVESNIRYEQPALYRSYIYIAKSLI